MTPLFKNAIEKKNYARPPVWFMRQAGRYHTHYQNLKKKHTFVEICKNPTLACEATLGPMKDFGFDAAILFSDLLFPLECLGFGLTYNPAPLLSFHLQNRQDVKKLAHGGHLAKNLSYQSEALQLIRKHLEPHHGLIGFVGAPFTLYCYATQGSHEAFVPKSVAVLSELYEPFCEKLFELLLQNMLDQAQWVDCLAVMDTAAGEVDFKIFLEKIYPSLQQLLTAFSHKSNVPILYYSKNTTAKHWRLLTDLPLAGIGIDWQTPLADVLEEFGERFVIQGNFNPHLLQHPQSELFLDDFFAPIAKLPRLKRKGWICGLGHGVLKNTPEENVRTFLTTQKKYFND